MTPLNAEARKSVLDALDALQQWSNEIVAVNDRGSTKAINRIAAALQAMGWPDHLDTSKSMLPGRMHYFVLFADARDSLLRASKLQTAEINKIAEACFASL